MVFGRSDVGLSKGQSYYFGMTHSAAQREPAVSLLICAFKKTNNQHVGIDRVQFIPMDIILPLLITWVLCVPVLHVCISIQVRIYVYCIVPLESYRKTSRERIVMLAYGKEQRVNAFKFVLFFPTEKAKLVTFLLLLQIRITIQSSFGIMDQFAFC